MAPVALVVGASRGIGRQVALTLAADGYRVGVAAKSVSECDSLPGTVQTVTEDIGRRGGQALALPCNVRDPDQVRATVRACLDKWGRLDAVVYNAGAIWWEKVQDTPLKRFDLMMDVNARGAYSTIQAVLPHFLSKKSGKILLVSPPIYSRFFKGKTAYSVSKVGMTILTKGLAAELQDTGVSVTSLWPATIIESHVTVKKNVPPNLYRKATVFSDACLRILRDETDGLNGEALIDEDFLRTTGVTDFAKYRADPGSEPPRMMPRTFPDLTVADEDFDSKTFSNL